MRASFKNILTIRKLLILILLVNLISRLFLVSKPLSLLDGKFIPDDSYLSWNIARNIAEGNGPIYSGTYTNGFQPLYVFAVAPFFHIFQGDLITPIKLSLILLSLFDTATLLIILLWVRSLTKNNTIVGITVIFWIFNDYVIRTALNGLETIMACFFIVWACYMFFKLYFIEIKPSNSQYLTLGIITGFACFTRVDSGILALILGLLIVFYEGLTPRMLLRGSLFSLGVLAIFSIWVAYSYYYTGGWYPESGKAVRFMSLANTDHTPDFAWYKEMISGAVYIQLRENKLLLILIIILFISSMVLQKISISALTKVKPLILFCASLFFAYTLYIFTSWYFDRYLFVFTILYILIVAILLNAVIETVTKKQSIVLYSIIILVWFVNLFHRGLFTDYYTGKENPNLGYMNLGIWARKHLPDGSKVGCSQSGALSYFATNIEVINLDGVVNKECYNSLVEYRNMDYIKKMKIDYVVGWPVNISFIKQHSKKMKKSDLSLLYQIKGFKSWNNTWYLYKINK